jgi:predicted nucleic acid-binding protein
MTAGFLLDTNVVSELVASAPAPQVLAWMTAQAPPLLFLSVIMLGELTYGVTRLSAGRRREHLTQWITGELATQFAGRVLGFDQAMSMRWGELRAQAERLGRPRNTVDLQLAATAAERGLRVVTRNLRDFEGLGVETLSPWQVA